MRRAGSAPSTAPSTYAIGSECATTSTVSSRPLEQPAERAGVAGDDRVPALAVAGRHVGRAVRPRPLAVRLERAALEGAVARVVQLRPRLGRDVAAGERELGGPARPRERGGDAEARSARRRAPRRGGAPAPRPRASAGPPRRRRCSARPACSCRSRRGGPGSPSHGGARVGSRHGAAVADRPRPRRVPRPRPPARRRRRRAARAAAGAAGHARRAARRGAGGARRRGRSPSTAPRPDALLARGDATCSSSTRSSPGTRASSAT